MDQPAGLAVERSHATYRVEGDMRFEDAIELASRAVAWCREQRIERLLMDGRGVTGFGPQDEPGRFRLAEELARAARASVKVVILVRPEFLNEDRFAITVARNRGLFVNVFAAEKEAVAWLLDPNAA